MGRLLGNLSYCCVKMCEAIELPFGVVSGVGPRKGCYGLRSPVGKCSFGGGV